METMAIEVMTPALVAIAMISRQAYVEYGCAFKVSLYFRIKNSLQSAMIQPEIVEMEGLFFQFIIIIFFISASVIDFNKFDKPFQYSKFQLLTRIYRTYNSCFRSLIQYPLMGVMVITINMYTNSSFLCYIQNKGVRPRSFSPSASVSRVVTNKRSRCCCSIMVLASLTRICASAVETARDNCNKY